MSDLEHSPVKHINPPKTVEPAELSTIAAILLKRNYPLYKTPLADPAKLALVKLYYITRTRKLTDAEAKKALALLAIYRDNK